LHKYTFGFLAAFCILAVGVFLVVAWRNGAEAGPAGSITITVESDRAAPRRATVREGELVELSFVNRTGAPLALASDAGAVEQLLTAEGNDLFDPRQPTTFDSLNLGARPGERVATHARFVRRGNIEIAIRTTTGVVLDRISVIVE
jgi:hypothetical protein